MNVLRLSLLLCLCFASLAGGGEPAAAVRCEGWYPRHLQGLCRDDRGDLYWSFTDVLVKTDSKGRLLKKIPADNHHGDLCAVGETIVVAVNLGKFNRPAGAADSWLYEYSHQLALVARHPAAEVVHGAGGVAYRDGRFFVVGGLPPGAAANLVYEYDERFRFVARREIPGYTLMGVQTVTFAAESWWFGCYGTPKVLLRTDAEFRSPRVFVFDAAYGIAALGEAGGDGSDGGRRPRFFIGRDRFEKDKGHRGEAVVAEASQPEGLVLVDAASK